MHGHEHLEFTPGFSPWLVVAIFAALVVLGAVLWFLWAHRSHTDTGPEKSEGNPSAPKDNEMKVMYGENIQILEMLRQQGGPMSQAEISEQMGTETERIAGVLKDMEAKGLIERHWDAAKKTFIVALREW